MIAARFDTIVDPCNVHHALHPDSLFCNDIKLEWEPMINSYLDTSLDPEFVVLGEDYEFVVHGGDEVPDLTQSITIRRSNPT